MQAKKLYTTLEKEFIKPGMWDEWDKYMQPFPDYVCAQFQQHKMGLVCDFSPIIKKVYTAVFASKRVM